MDFELTIAHRVCPSLSKTAIGFSDKPSMVKATAESLAASLHEFGKTTRLIAILDGCGESYESLFQQTFSSVKNVHLEIIKTASIGNQATYAKQNEVLLEAQNTRLVYFSEDDYVYATNAFSAMADMLSRPDVDFVTPLDHPDRYNHVLSAPKSAEVKVSPYCHWRTVGTSCLTFMTTSKILHECSSFLKTFGTGAMDGTMWLGLTKEDVRDFSKVIPPAFAYICGRDKPFGYYMPLCAWKHHGMKILTTRKYKLWQPIPSLAVHLSGTSLPLHSSSIFAIPDEKANALLKETELAYLELLNRQ